MRFNIYLITIFTSLFCSCATKEYKAAEQVCIRQGYQNFPENFKEVVVSEDYYEQVPTGEYNCTAKTTGSYDFYGATLQENKQTDSNCKPVTKGKWLTRQVNKVIDTNEKDRNSWVDQCTVNSCFKTFGNSECKPTSK